MAYGFAWNYGSRDEAVEVAVNACLAGGGTECVELAWFQNGCGALAVDQYAWRRERAGCLWNRRKRAPCGPARLPEVPAAPLSGPNAPGRVVRWARGRAARASLRCRKSREASRPGEPTAVTGRNRSARRRMYRSPREQRIRVQLGLAALGFDAGPADGMFGPRTRSAIWEWQQAKGLEATGYLTQDEAEALAALRG